MNIYMVIGGVYSTGIQEMVKVYEGMEERRSTYVGGGKRIAKKLIGRLDTDVVIGRYKVAVIDEHDIPQARLMIINQLKNDNERVLQELKSQQEHLSHFSVDTPIIYQ